MKRIQTAVLIIVCTITSSAVSLAKADLPPDPSTSAVSRQTVSVVAMAKADSLFRLKQYTESFEIYQKLFQFKYYSPSMLLKMAYIQEGLGSLAQSMYYLNLYYLSTHDQQALYKLEEVAGKNRLEGYDNSDATRLFTMIKENQLRISMGLAAVCILMLALAFYQKVRRNHRPIAPALLLLFFLALLFSNNFLITGANEGIIATPSTYLMEGPSAGSPVIAIVGEGHRIEILGRKDVWLKVKWNENEVFVKQNGVLTLDL